MYRLDEGSALHGCCVQEGCDHERCDHESCERGGEIDVAVRLSVFVHTLFTALCLSIWLLRGVSHWSTTILSLEILPVIETIFEQLSNPSQLHLHDQKFEADTRLDRRRRLH